jgi:hypothetical protein
MKYNNNLIYENSLIIRYYVISLPINITEDYEELELDRL